jgi:hypothetical protein
MLETMSDIIKSSKYIDREIGCKAFLDTDTTENANRLEQTLIQKRSSVRPNL